MRKRNPMRKKLLAVVLLLTLLLSAAFSHAESAPDYYKIGLEVAGVLDEMLQSPFYQKFILSSPDFISAVSETLNTGDYDKPVAVYRLEQKDARQWLLAMIPEDSRQELEALSPALQEQLFARTAGLSTICSFINAQKSSNMVAAASALQVLLKKPELEIEEPEYCLFTFEKGTPILVSYTWHSAVGTICALSAEDTASADALNAALKPYGVEASVLEQP